MNFYIKQHSDLPILVFPLTDKIMEKYNINDDMMENVGITFSMIDENNRFIIANKGGEILYRKDIFETPHLYKYSLIYKFNKFETYNSGKFYGEFKLNFIGEYCNTITLPNNNDINIFITESSTKVEII